MAQKVKVFTTQTCVYCKMLKEYLKNMNVDYEEIQLDEQPQQVQASLDACGSMGVPCTHIVTDDGKEESILGFDKAKINQILGL